MTAVQSLRPTARPLASEKKFCMAVNINSGPERTPPSARPSRDGRVPQPARTNCLLAFLILMHL